MRTKIGAFAAVAGLALALGRVRRLALQSWRPSSIPTATPRSAASRSRHSSGDSDAGVAVLLRWIYASEHNLNFLDPRSGHRLLWSRSISMPCRVTTLPERRHGLLEQDSEFVAYTCVDGRRELQLFWRQGRLPRISRAGGHNICLGAGACDMGHDGRRLLWPRRCRDIDRTDKPPGRTATLALGRRKDRGVTIARRGRRAAVPTAQTARPAQGDTPLPFSLWEKVDAPTARPDEGPGATGASAPPRELTPDPSPAIGRPEGRPSFGGL